MAGIKIYTGRHQDIRRIKIWPASRYTLAGIKISPASRYGRHQDIHWPASRYPPPYQLAVPLFSMHYVGRLSRYSSFEPAGRSRYDTLSRLRYWCPWSGYGIHIPTRVPYYRLNSSKSIWPDPSKSISCSTRCTSCTCACERICSLARE